MSISPVKFATAFERLRTQLGAIQSESARLQLLMTFWPEIKAVRGNQTFSGFVEEYNGLLAKALTAAAITDLDADGLAQLESQIADLTAVDIGADKMAAVKMGRARLLLYLGETDAGVAAAAEAANVRHEPAEQSAAGRHRSEFERFEQAYNALTESELKRQLQPILEDWQARREAVHHDRAVCVFVAKGTVEGSSDGRMRVLRAQIEPASKAAPGGQVTFDNQIRTPQDPFVGSAYAALAAVRGYLAESGYSGRAKSHLNAHFTVEDSGETFTGDSIGLAIALLTYTQLLQLEVERQDRFLAAEAAYTGAVSPEGEILPVSDESIGAKVKRVFHSPVRFLVLPQANYAAARAALEQLEAAYPRRNLTLIPVRHLADCLNDHNVVRSQKVCIGEYVARRAAKYSRTTAVQVVMLGVVVYLLMAVLSPRTFWPWFEWKIDRVQINEFDFSVLRADGTILWRSQRFNHALNSTAYSFSSNIQQSYAVVDFDGDGRDEFCFVPKTQENSELNSMIFFYGHRGDLIGSARAFSLTDYPGDITLGEDTLNTDYFANWIIPIRYRLTATALLAISQVSNPARQQILILDSKGELLSGPYLNTGYSVYAPALLDIDGNGDDEIVVYGMNNRSDKAFIAVLDPSSLSGISPPYDDDRFLQSHESNGSQLWYIDLPGTRFSDVGESRPAVRMFEAIGAPVSGYRAIVRDGCGRVLNGKSVRCNEDSDPHITYFVEFDSTFRVTRVFLGDNQLERLNYNLKANGQAPYATRAEVESELTRGIKVYRGSQLVPDSLTRSLIYY